MLEQYQSFYLNTPDDLRQEILRLGLDLPVAEDLAPLSAPLTLGKQVVSNRLWLQPMQGFDAEPSGAPSAGTIAHYQRYAAGGYGLLWIEATAAGENNRDGSRSLCLSDETFPDFCLWVQALRATAQAAGTEKLSLVLQITVQTSGGEQDQLYDRWVTDCAATAALAKQAGFDGVDIKCCYGDALFEQLTDAAADRNVLLEIMQCIHDEQAELLLATRLTLYDAKGFGVHPDHFRKTDLSRPIALLKELQAVGLSILNVSTCSPNLEQPDQPLEDREAPQEHPLMGLQRTQDILKDVKAALPDLACVAGGLSWLRHLLPEVAATWVAEGWVSGVGFARSAMAYPNAAQDILIRGTMSPEKTCMACFACNDLMQAGAPTGCVIRDAEIYGSPYRNLERFDLQRLLAGAGRCHGCEHAPCMVASPSSVDIPTMVRHFAAGRFDQAFNVLRKGNVFPEMSAQLCPAWLQAEGACIETILGGESVPIGDIQMTLARWAIDNVDRGIDLPAAVSGKRVAVMGGGPSGLAAAAGLLESGHEVVLLEREKVLGGAPQLFIPSHRFPDALPEVEAVLNPAIEQGRLQIQYGQELGRNVEMVDVLAAYDAVLLAIGLSREASIGQGRGVVDALTFLREVKSGERDSIPKRVAVLSGGDCAMDAAQEAKALGAEEVFIVFEGPRAAMHWHLSEDWFASQGVHCLILTRPIEYLFNTAGDLEGLRIVRMDSGAPVLESESVLAVDLVVEAMGLSVQASLQHEVHKVGCDALFAAGALCNGGASVEQCIAEGLMVAEKIDQFLRR